VLQSSDAVTASGRTATLEAAIRGELNAAGLRATPARIGVLAKLRRLSGPVSHAELSDLLAAEPWDRATVFRCLVAFVGAGLASRVDLGDHVWRFVAKAGPSAAGAGTRAQPAAAHDHPHLLCTSCGAVTCLPGAQLSIVRGARVPKSVRAANTDVQVRGLCDACV
jgi:Fur family ferric uptake transcriptional regulator